MANYETLADGGHEHLIATVKPLVDQKANEHDIDVSVKELVENQPRGQLTGEILSTSHAYDMPPVSVIVDGKSTQVTTTGKNLFDKSNRGYWDGNVGTEGHISGATSSVGYAYFRISVTEGDTVYVRDSQSAHRLAWNNGLIVANTGITFPYTVPSGVDEVSGYFQGSYIDTGIVTINNADTSYEPYTDGKPSPSPDYPQEITSVDGCALKFAGKNLAQLSDGTETKVDNGLTFTKNGQNLKVSGTTTNWNIDSMYLKLQSEPLLTAGNTYTISLQGTYNGITNSSLYYYTRMPDGIEETMYSTTIRNQQIKLEPPSDCIVTKFRLRVGQTSGTVDVDVYPQIEVGSTATAYEPYACTTVPIYDGTLRSLPDGTKDKLALSYLRPSTREGWAWYSRVVERVINIATASTFTSYDGRTRHGSNPGCVFGIAIDAPAVNVLGYCSHGVWVEGTTATENYGQFGRAWVTHNDPNLLKFTIAPDRSSLALGNEWLAENGPITFVYKLATPVTTTLDPIELPHMPLGDVTIWSDPVTGLMVNYIVEGKAIEETLETGIANALAAIATVETSPTTYNHAVGSRIVYDEVLYRVTSAIASGEDIVPGTNVEATTVTDEIKRLQQ